jgi:hypothetical protein
MRRGSCSSKILFHTTQQGTPGTTRFCWPQPQGRDSDGSARCRGPYQRTSAQAHSCQRKWSLTILTMLGYVTVVHLAPAVFGLVASQPCHQPSGELSSQPTSQNKSSLIKTRMAS